MSALVAHYWSRALAQNLVMKQGVWSTYRAGCQAAQPHLDELSERMTWLEQTGLSKPLMHIVDREADSIAHLRAGQQVESWEQETGLAILKRILIASHACALAWALQRATDPDTQATATFVVRLSGRQMERSQPVTASALLAGLYQLFAMLEILEHHSLDELKTHARLAFPQFSRFWS